MANTPYLYINRDIMKPEGPLFHKPNSIVAAKNILYATVFLDIISSLIGEFSAGMHNYSSVQGLASTILSIGLIIVIIREIGFGHKWARTLFLILLILEVVSMPFYISILFKASIVLGFLFGLQVLLQILALYFLFSKPSSKWFNSFNTNGPAIS
jgi:hypothetical protein